MKVLVTGAAGYIGSVLVRQLVLKGHQVIGVDNLSFGGESLVSVYSDKNFTFFKGDVGDKDFMSNLLKKVDSVVHLAAIVGDPACAKQPELARKINWDYAKQLIDFCNQCENIKRFVFASTCSNYGKMEGNDMLDEKSTLNPVSLYAELKVKFEEYLLNTNFRDDFVVTPLRFATVYGLSPRLRFDLTVNEFTREITLGKELIIFGEQFWRPYCHVEDLAGACVLVLESPKEKVNKEVFGVGDSDENYQKKMIADILLQQMPKAKIRYVKKDEDPRDYRVNFSKIKSQLGFNITKTVPEGISEIKNVIEQGIVQDPYSEKYKNI